MKKVLTDKEKDVNMKFHCEMVDKQKTKKIKKFLTTALYSDKITELCQTRTTKCTLTNKQ